MTAIMSEDSSICSSQFQPHLKYLGVFLGFNVHDLNWSGPVRSFINVVKVISFLECGVLTKIALYNMLAISKLGYVATFFAPTASVFKAEDRALQLLLKGPWNAIPGRIMKNLKQFGFPIEARDLSALASAASVRCAGQTCSVLHTCITKIRDMMENSPDLVLSELTGSHFSTSILHHLDACLQGYRDTSCGYDDKGLQQRLLYKYFRLNGNQVSVSDFILLRVSHFLPAGTFEHSIPGLVEHYQGLCRKGFPGLVFTHFRLVCNHWCTNSRFGADATPCPFQCGHECDKVAHVACCPVYWQCFCSIVGTTEFCLGIHDALTVAHHGSTLSDDASLMFLFGLHICFLIFNKLRHGGKFSTPEVRHLIRQYAASHCKIRPVIRHAAGIVV